MRVASTCSYVHGCPAKIGISQAEKKHENRTPMEMSSSTYRNLSPTAQTMGPANKSKPRFQPSNPLNDSAGGQNATPANEKTPRR